jgi:hypothetical protein
LRIGGIAADPETSSQTVAGGQGFTVFALSGHMKAEEVAELKAVLDTDYRTIVLDLRERPTFASGWAEKKVEGVGTSN